ncbi:alpha/beta fold hydrolase [Nocardia goodfellowii]
MLQEKAWSGRRLSALVAGCALVLGACTSTASSEDARPSRTVETVSYADVRIEVTAEGAGPTVVFLPSLGRDSHDYDEVSALLAADGYRVLRPQPRGVDGSTGPMTGLTLRELATDVAEVIEHENNGPAIIVGHAFGHYVARMLDVIRPDLVDGIVLAAASERNFAPGLSELVAKCSDLSLPEAERLACLEQVFFAPGNDARIWLGGWYGETQEMQRAAVSATPKDIWWAVADAPLLDLQADLDPFRPESSIDELKNQFGDLVTIARVSNTRHALIPEAPEAVASEVDSWITSLKR